MLMLLQIVEVNASLTEDPAIVNKSAETEGWIAKVRTPRSPLPALHYEFPPSLLDHSKLSLCAVCASSRPRPKGRKPDLCAVPRLP